MRSIHRVWLAAGLLAVAANCSLTQQLPEAEIAVAKALVSDEQEAQLGQQIHQELQAEGMKFSNDPVLTKYVEGLVAKIAPYARKDRDVPFTVHVIEDPKTVNAFVTPGGHVYVYTGLLLAADNESEVLGVLAHELGHVVRRHAARQLVAQFGLQTVAALALGENPNVLKQVGAAIVANGALLANSRGDEKEADTYAVRYTAQAGYDPRGIAMFFRKLPAKSGTLNKLLTYLQTHPATPDRIEHVNQVIAREHLAGSKVGKEELQAIKQHLQTGAPVSWR
jgi:beta-barrel assembly-enhancing protease